VINGRRRSRQAHHDYHLVNPSPWPIVGAVSAFVLAIGAILFMRHVTPWIMLIGFVGVLYTMYAWWSDVIKRVARRRPHAGRGDFPPLRHDAVHRLRGDVLRRLVLGLLRRLLPSRRSAAIWSHRSHGRCLAADRRRAVQPLAPAAVQYAAAADLRHDRYLGPSCAAAERPAGAEIRPRPDHPAGHVLHPGAGDRIQPTPASPIPATFTARPSSWRPASMVSMSSSAPFF